MIIYIIALMLSLFFVFISKKIESKKIRILLCFFSAIPFFLVSAIRYDVGTDYLFRYVNDYDVLVNGGKVDNLEIGFKLLVKLCILLKSNYQLIFIISSLIITLFVFYTIYRDSNNAMLSILLYFVGAFFFQSLNMIRQYISISIILFSYKYFLDGKWIKWIGFVVLAAFFHTTSLIFAIINIMIYAINKLLHKDILLNKKIVFALIILLFIAKPFIKNIINFLLSMTRFDVYINSSYNQGDLQIIPFIINLLLYIGMMYIYKKRKDKVTKVDYFFILMQIVALIFVTLGNISYLSIRLVYYFSIFQIISIPHFLTNLKNIYNSKYNIICTVLIILMFSSSLVWTHVLHTTDEILPYKTIFNKEYEFK